MTEHRPSRGSWTVVLTRAAVLGVLVLVFAGVAWHLQGGRWFVTTSPSMGRELPVGSLLLTEPSDVDATAVGDVVTFRSPSSGVVFTHRVIAADGAGLETQGDVNAVPDAWVITDGELIGDVVWHAPIVGRVAQALPLLLVGMVAVWLVTRWCTAARRRSWRLMGSSTVVALVGWWLSPWVGMSRLGQAAAPEGENGVLMDVISTGLLPIEAREVDGPARAHLVDGQVGQLHLTAGADTGAFDVTAVLDLPWWGWVVLGLVCLVPLWWSLLVGAPEPAAPPRHRAPVDEAGDGGAPDAAPVVDDGPWSRQARQLTGSAA